MTERFHSRYWRNRLRDLIFCKHLSPAIRNKMIKKNFNFRELLYSLLFYNSLSKKIAVFLLNSSWFVNNPVYSLLQKKYINKVIKKYSMIPNLVVIENTNLCNSHCSMCPHDIMKRKKGIMSQELYEKIINQCAKLGIKKISLHNFGEPLLDKAFSERVQYAKTKGISYVGTATNASLLTPALSKKIILSGLDAINFSLDAYSKKAYEKIRVGLPFDKVMTNVKEFIKIRNELNSHKPEIYVDLIETEFNKGETNKFIKKWEKLVDKVDITTLHSWGGRYQKEIGKRTLHFHNSKISREPCRFLFTDMVINWDGQVSACCQDFDAKLVIGDLKKESLKDIWRGEKLNKIRKIHLQGQMESINLCKTCDYRSVWWLFK